MELTFITTVLTDHGGLIGTLLDHMTRLLTEAADHLLRVGTLGTAVTELVRCCGPPESWFLPSLATAETFVITSGLFAYKIVGIVKTIVTEASVVGGCVPIKVNISSSRKTQSRAHTQLGHHWSSSLVQKCSDRQNRPGRCSSPT